MRVLVDYDAFISYNRKADWINALRLQRLIRRVGRPWNQPGSLRVFRDTTNLRLSPSLKHSLVDALDRTDTFVLMASPDSAKSEWVRFEVDHWRQHREQNKFVIVHTAGEIHWDDQRGDFDWDRTTALPREIEGWYGDQPIWGTIVADGTRRRAALLRDVAVSIAAQLYGVEKDRLHNEDELELRKTRRAWRATFSVLAMAVVGVLIAGAIAVWQGGEASTQEQNALSRRLAGASESQLANSLDVASLLAARAFRTDANPQTRAALFRAVTTSGSLVRYLPFEAEITRLATSADGSAIVVGLRDGKVLRWRLADGKPEQLVDLAAEVTALAVNENGDTVIAADVSSVRLVRKDRSTESIPAAWGFEFRAVAVSPSGRTAVATSDKDSAVVSVFNLDGDTVRKVDHPAGDAFTLGPDAVVSSDEEVFLLDSGYGFWERRRITDWNLTFGSRVSFGTANYGQAVSADGRAFSYTNGAATISVWSTDRPSDIDHPDLTARAQIAKPSAMSLSADASHLAIAEDGAIHVSRVLPAEVPPAEPVKLTGTGTITTRGLAFLGTSSRKLVSASGSRVTLWDLDQIDRIGRAFPVSLRAGCNACGPPNIALSHDAAQMIAIDGSGWEGVVGPVTHPEQLRALPNLNLSARYGPAVWNGSDAAVVVQPETGGSQAVVPTGFPDHVHAVAAGERDGEVIAAALSSDRRRLIVVQADGGFDLVDLTSGATQRVVPDPSAPDRPKAPVVRAAAANADLVAVADEKSISVRDVPTGKVIGEITRSGVRYLAFVPGRLLVQLESGELEIWDERLTGRQSTIAGDAGFIWRPISNGTLVARARADNAITLADLATGSVLASIPGDSARRVGIGFSGDGTRMLTLTESRDSGPATAVLRDISDDTLVRAACSTAGRDLTADEWRALVGTDSVPDDLRCQ
ncbi:hypothetical protein ACFOWZ_27240 [Lentzea rhizosphaerae]|uniref:TIR domain-containing protein n=1 Tax=Lentzea rhizosphaerae TaxID=2041025 RepID=A0ABV8BZJ6_9PSEU